MGILHSPMINKIMKLQINVVRIKPRKSSAKTYNINVANSKTALFSLSITRILELVFQTWRCL